MTSTYKALVIPADGKVELRTVADDSVEAMQSLVGGYVEAVGFEHGYLFLDEDGISKGLSANPRAMALFPRLGMSLHSPLLGDVAFVGHHPNDPSAIGDVSPVVLKAAAQYLS